MVSPSDKQSLGRRLQLAFPYSSTLRESLPTIGFISGFVLLWFALFGEVEGGWEQQIGYACLFGGATFLVAVANILLVQGLVSPQLEQQWKVKHEISVYLWQFFSIALVIYVLTVWFMELPFTAWTLFNSLFSTVLIGAIPVSIHVLRQQNKWLKQHLTEAAQITPSSSPPTTPPVSDPQEGSPLPSSRKMTLILGEQEVAPSDILFAESDKNYLNIHLLDQPTLRIRSTVKEFGQKVESDDQLIRCHRAFFVNLQHLKEVSGNAQGLSLSLRGTDHIIPVSRAYIPSLKARI
ncbi:MAG: LytTR family DNA-binding domain-containing protein [Bacteroidota bacterium]